MVSVNPLPENFSLRVVPHQPEYSSGLVGQIDEFWEGRRSRQNFDAPVLCVKGFESEVLEVFPIPYRFLFAQIKEPAFSPLLRLNVLAVTGLLEKNGHYLVGLRAPWVTQFPEHWELAPSGGVGQDFFSNDHVDLEGQLVQEFKEELSLDPSWIEGIEPRFLLSNPRHYTLDILFHIKMNKEAPEPQGNREYSLLSWVRKELPEPLEPLTKAVFDQIL